MSYETLITSFHAMWGNFPVRCRLIRADRTVLAVNKAAAAEGCTTGGKCIQQGDAASHAGCQAARALKLGRATQSPSVDSARLRHWVPVDGHADVYVHFSLPIA